MSSCRQVSAFPAEIEYLYPPLTYLKTSGRPIHIKIGTKCFTVIDVLPYL